MLVWLKGEIISPPRPNCGACGALMPGDANILVHFANRVTHEDPAREELPWAEVKKVRCDNCKKAGI